MENYSGPRGQNLFSGKLHAQSQMEGLSNASQNFPIISGSASENRPILSYLFNGVSSIKRIQSKILSAISVLLL